MEYIFRPAPLHASDVEEQRKPALTGYGVSLDLKKMDYLAVDDRQLHQGSASSNEKNSAQAVVGEESVDHITELLDQYPSLYDTVNASHPLSGQELRGSYLVEENSVVADHCVNSTWVASYSAHPVFILAAVHFEDPRSGLPEIRCFCLEARQPGRKVDRRRSGREQPKDYSRDEPHVDQRRRRSTQGHQSPRVCLSQNSYPFSLAQYLSYLRLLRVLDKERLISLSLQSLGLNVSQVSDLITHSAISAAQTTASSGVTSGLFDSSDRQEGEGTIIWWNDIEKDVRYAKWSSSIHQVGLGSFLSCTMR